MRIESMQDLFLEQIQDLYDAEQRLTKALPDMAQAATSPELRRAFQDHLNETKGHVTRLERIFESMGKNPKATTCDAMKGLIKEGETMVDDIKQSALRDAGLIAAANRVEHYEIAAYGSARTFAKNLSMDRAVVLLEETLEEEKAADHRLTELAETSINAQAQATHMAGR
jgi:ferritin-like metal-binding protein YciE